MREGQSGLDRGGGQDRQDLAREEAGQKPELLRREVLRAQEMDPALAERGNDLALIGRVGDPGQTVAALLDLGQDRRRGLFPRPFAVHPGRHRLAQPRDADHEELVQVRKEDPEEPSPLHKGHGGILRFLEHPPVEAEPGQSAAQVARFGRGGAVGHTISRNTGFRPKTSSKRPPF